MRFRRWLAVIVVAGLVLRVLYVLHVVRHTPLGADAIWYQLQGAFIRDGRGYIDPATYFEGRSVPTATFPPLYPAFLALVSWLESSATVTLRLAGCVPAAATIALTGLLGRRVLHDERVALAAAAIVAASPLVIATDTSLMSETLSVPLSLLVLLLVHRLATRHAPASIDSDAAPGSDDPAGTARTLDGERLRGLALIGLVAGVAMLARNDVLVLAVIAVALTQLAVRERWALIVGASVTVVLVAGIVVTPWVVRNVRALDVATLSTTSLSTAVAGANCPSTYYGDELGGWAFECISVEQRRPDNEVAYSDAILERGLTYARDHAGRVPVVVAARVMRLWGAWDPTDLAEDEAIESRRYGWHLAGWGFAGTTTVLAGAGLVLLRRNRLALATLAAPLLAVTATAVLTYGNQRFRAPAEPVLAVLAAHAVITIWSRRRPVRLR